jgi:hypothetical protein
VNYSKYFECSPGWHEVRDHAIDNADAIAVLSQVLKGDARHTFGTYTAKCGSLMNAAVVQVLLLARRAAALDIAGSGRRLHAT